MRDTVALHLASRWISPRRERFAWAWLSTWRLLCRLLLGADGAVVRRWDDELAVDSRTRYSSCWKKQLRLAERKSARRRSSHYGKRIINKFGTRIARGTSIS